MSNKKDRDRIMKRFYLKLIFIFTMALSILFFIVYIRLTNISYNEGFVLNKNIRQIKKGRTIKIGVVSRYSPSLIYDGYQPIIDYLNENTGYSFKLVLSKNYLNTVNQLVKREIDFAFLGDIVFVSTWEKAKLMPVVCPVNSNDKPYLRATIIVRDDSKIENFCQLNGKKIALPSTSSFSSKWGKLKIKECGIKAILKEFNFHHTVVLQVLNGVCSAGVVREYVAEEFKGKGIKIIGFSPPIPSPPLVTLSSTNKKLVKDVQDALLKFTGAKTTSPLIDKEFYYGFTVPDKSLYLNFEKFLRETGIFK